MNFQISLNTAIQLFNEPCSVASGKKTNITALDYIHLSIENGIAEVIGTDTQALIRTSANVDVDENLEICIESKKLLAVITGCNDNSKNLKFKFSQDKVIISYARSKVSIATIDSEAYPIPEIKIPNKFQFNCKTEELKVALSNILYAKANNDSRAFLNHVSFNIQGKSMALYASDGHRLASNTVTVEESSNDLQGLIPSKLAEMILQLPQSELVSFFFDSSHFFCVSNNTVIASKFVATQFTDVTHILNTNLIATATILTSDLIGSVKRIRTFLSGVSIAKLTLQVSGGELFLNAQADKANVIDDVVTLESASADSELTFSLNPSYLFDALKNVKSKSVSVSFTPNSLLKITDPNNPYLSSVIMAMR
ncbi:DNA polymerase III subunit beta [Pseudoalteromonas sp. MQS005]|uniref:DNA polymerase III subunit beta n=1 Tax=Pseudoalteromonas sp. MQS005 TaxID=1854052 RepID=UPI0007E5124E|nr:DNA polymerase III subunit beta [Pseudoalteromonas sp. MQS005]